MTSVPPMRNPEGRNVTDAPQGPAGHARIQWGVKVPMRDGVQLNATLYLPTLHTGRNPTILAMTPYVAQSIHDQACEFAAHGYPFLAVDVRGRGNSEGSFTLLGEAHDAHDAVEWVAGQSYCDGQVAMWGGSYAGWIQWMAAKEVPPHLATIVPTASPYRGVDTPLRNNLFGTYTMRWLTALSGRTMQDAIFADRTFWMGQFRRWHEAGLPYAELDTFLGNPTPLFQEWISYPQRDDYWDAHNPTVEEYARLALPVLTITGICDANQLGSLEHHRQHLRHTRQRDPCHYLVIGPWDHAGTRKPTTDFAGLRTGAESLIDLRKLHRDWYAWIMQGGPRPAFLQNNVAYYVLGADRWRYAETLEAITPRLQVLYLHSSGNPTDVFSSGALSNEPPRESRPDQYLYDPCDVSLAGLESTVAAESRTDHRLIHASAGKHLVYHSGRFERDTEISGFFRLDAYLSLDQPDTDFRVSVYAIDGNGGATELATDCMRARYRESLRRSTLVQTTEPLLYRFERFPFVSYLLRYGERLRLVIGPVNSIHAQKNYNSGGVVSRESRRDARTVTVKLFHDAAHASALHVPLGRPGI